MSPAFSKLEAVPAGAAVFVDANIFIYHFLGVSRECEAFLERCAVGEVKAVTGTHIAAEVLHRLMIAEARVKSAGKTKGQAVRAKEGGKGGWVRYLESRPDEVRRLTDHHAAAAVIEQVVGTILPLTMDVVRASQWARNRDGLMVNDSLTAAMIRAGGIGHLASNDAAFLRVDGLAVYRPGDVPFDSNDTSRKADAVKRILEARSQFGRAKIDADSVIDESRKALRKRP